MVDQQLESLEEPYNIKPKKPIFLIVICIISLVEAGWSVIGSFSSLLMNNFNPANAQDLDQFKQLMDMQLSEGWFNPDVDIPQLVQFDFFSQWVSLAAGALIFIFVFAMLKRKKEGFYPFVVTKVLLIIAPIYLATIFTSGSFIAQLFFWITIGMGIHHVVFIWMFAVNKKYLN
jgi:hypothetical protein